MIIEFFGAPGAGKTTLASALAGRLRERGHMVEIISSLGYRPTEHRSGRLDASLRHRVGTTARRLILPMVDMLSRAGQLFANSREAREATAILRILPPKNLIWLLRMYQYILRSICAWQRARLTADIVVFDQGFVQAVYSLALVSRTVDEELIARALSAIPESDLLIRLDAPREILASRLADRRSRQSKVERLLEFDLKTTLESVPIIDHLHELLLKRGRPVIRLDSLDQASLCDAVAKIGREVQARLDAEPAAPLGTCRRAERDRPLDDWCRHA